MLLPLIRGLAGNSVVCREVFLLEDGRLQVKHMDQCLDNGVFANVPPWAGVRVSLTERSGQSLWLISLAI